MKYLLSSISIATFSLLFNPIHAFATDISPVPLANIGDSGSVKPNIMVMIDNSGSMDYDYAGDYVSDGYCKNGTVSNFKGSCCTNKSDSSSSPSGACWTGNAPFTWRGHPPFLNSDFNGMAYNPASVYTAPIKSDLTSWANMKSPWTAVKNDAYNIQDKGTINLINGFPDMQWCTTSALTTCIRNGNYLLPGIVAGVEYAFLKMTVGTGTGQMAIGAPGSATLSASKTFGPHYYGIKPGEYCTTENRTICRKQAAPDSTYKYAATIRWCSDNALTICQSIKTDKFIYPRYPGRETSSAALVTIDVKGVNTAITNISVNGFNIMNAKTAKNNNNTSLAALVVATINKCSVTKIGTCTIAGYSASNVGNIITIQAPIGQITTTITPIVNPASSATAQPFDLSSGSIPGEFVRIDIIPGINSYADPASLTNEKNPARSDCVGKTCTYEEEMTNFANWWTYYHSRMQTMKSAMGISFAGIGSGYNVGISMLSDIGYDGLVTDGSRGMYPELFVGTSRDKWYAKLVAANPSSSTPLRSALDSIGKMYANLDPYKFTGDARVVKYACQQNFAMITTDGYWNQTYDGLVKNNDLVENASRFCLRSTGCADPSAAAENCSLADVALYWYNGGSNTSTVSLVPELDPSMTVAGKVPTTNTDPNTHLHLTTYTLGLGIDGNVNYEKNYDTSPSADGDFAKIINNTANWPQAKQTSAAAVDDLWHAAINGHGKYFSARTPDEVVTGLKEALASMQIKNGASAASATSTPNISKTDNDIFSSTYTTNKWFGEIYSQKIDATTGATLDPKVWTSSLTIGKKVKSNADTRSIYMSSTSGIRKNYLYSEMTAAEKAWFSNKGSTMQQYFKLSPSDKIIADSGENLVNWSRGQFQYADDSIYKAYSLYGSTLDPQNLTYNATTNPYIALGDVASAKPAYVRKSVKSYSFGGYSSFLSANNTRAGMVYIAANDGMLHAMNSNDGEEKWAYAPRITMSKIPSIASTGYSSNHRYLVDGTPEAADVFINGAWKTILVGGLNSGGRGYYAVDITNPVDPKPLWEFCSDSSICSSNDADIGLTFGNPQIGMWDKKWVVVVTSGYNNTPTTDYPSSGGDGKGYLYILDASNGIVLKKVPTNIGSTANPSGLGKILAITKNPQIDPNLTYVYGGDLLGNLWRFDLTSTTTINVVKMAELGDTHPITIKPDATMCGETRVVTFGTGRLLGQSDVIDKTVQSFYAVKDSGTALGNLNGLNSMIEQTWTAASTATSGIHTNKAVSWNTKNGWYIDLSRNPGERVTVDQRIAYGSVYFPVNLPTSDSNECSVGGSSYNNTFLVCGNSTDIKDSEGSVLVSSTSPVVGSTVIRLQNGKLISKLKLADGTSKDMELVSNGASPAARKAGWRTVKNN